MADSFFTFYPQFNEFLPIYRDVTRVWIGDGINTGTSGMLYAEYADGHVDEVGSVSLYATAVANGYTGTERDWVLMIMSVANLVTGSTVTISYKVSTSGTTHPDPSSGWSSTPVFEKGKFTWAKLDMRWIDGRTTTVYFASYQGLDGQVQSINNQTGNVTLHGANLPISGSSNTNIKAYIDEHITVTSVNGSTGDIVLRGDNVNISSSDTTKIKTYIDNKDSAMKTYVDGKATVQKVNNKTGNVTLHGNNVAISDSDDTTIKAYIDDKAQLIDVNGQVGHIVINGANLPITGTNNQSIKDYIDANDLVDSVNGETGAIVLHGQNLPIGQSDNTSIKNYIDENDIPDLATDEDIDALFSMAFFAGTAFITGRHFEHGDALTYKVEAVTSGAPMPESNTATINPTSGNSWQFIFGHIHYKLSDIPDGETTKTFTYRVTEHSHTMDGVPASQTVHTVSVTLTNLGEGILKITKSENFNKMFFLYEYTANGRIVFDGTITLNGRTMAAREFMVQIREGNEIIADNVSTLNAAASGVPSPISFPPINYTLADIGTHIYTVRETSISGDGVTISDVVHTVTVRVMDNIHDASLEIETDGTEHNLDFVNTYATTGSVVFNGRKVLIRRRFRDTDSLDITITGSAKLPSPATIPVTLTAGTTTAIFSFPSLTYNLEDMRNNVGGYDDYKVFTYNITETPNIPGTTTDGIAHTISVRVTDDKHGHLIIEPTYSDGERIELVATYNATGSLTVNGQKNLVNRRFIATDSMQARITSSNNARLPSPSNIVVNLAVGQHVTNFSFETMTYDIFDLNGSDTATFSYLITENTVISGATNDTNVHTLDVSVADNFDGTLSVIPIYSDGVKAVFESIYNATGYLGITGLKTIANRTFKNDDLLSVSITTNNGGRLPSPATISVPLTIGATSANFNFAQIAYVITDLNDATTRTFNYTITETASMDGTQPVSVTNTLSVVVTDQYDGTLNVVPTYSEGNRVNFTNTYSASADLSFKTRCVFTNGDMSTNPFSVRITQVTGNNSTTQATENVVLQAPVTQIASSGSTQDLNFSNIVHFIKNSNTDHTSSSYWFMIEEVLPAINARGVYNHVRYDTHKTWIHVSVADNYDGTLSITKTPAPDISTGLDDIFTNEQYANLIVNNFWTGDDSRLTSAEKNAFTYIVTGPNSYNESFTYEDMVNNIKTLEDLKLGAYTVVETNNIVENFVITVAYDVSGTATNTINLAAGGGRVNVTNNVNKLEGTLSIVKVWSGEHDLLTQQQKNGVTFTVTGPKQKSTDVSAFNRVFTYADMTNNRMTFEQLTLGTYSVVESYYTMTDFDVAVSYSVDGTNTNSATLTDGSTKSITITDDYTLHRGSAKVTKVFNGLTTKPVNYNITNDYDSNVFTYANADNAATADGIVTPYEWTISHIPVHTTIEFTEHNSAMTNYTLAASAIPANYTCAAITKDNTSTVAMTNTYTRHLGTVQVTKQFVGITAALKPENYSITNDYNDSVFTYANADNYTTTDGITSPYVWTISDVPVPTAIHFTEHNSNVTDYTVTAVAIPADYTSTPVVKDGTSTVAMTNTYVYDTGSVKVTKLFTGIDELLKPSLFNITNDYNNTVFTYANADNTATADGITVPYEWTITNVPVHTVITFTESGTSVSGYDFDSETVKSNSAVTKDTTSVVNFTNAYVQQVGTVKVTKQFTGLTSAQLPVSFSITNNYNSTVFTYANADNTATADGITVPYEWSITNVPVTTTITFSESGLSVADYDVTSSAVPVDYTCDAVQKNQTSTVALSNVYTMHTGSVKVTKQFVGITSLQEPANFSITNNYNATAFTYANADNAGTADGVVVPYEWTITDVPVHTVITFTENNTTVSRYDLSVSSETEKTSEAVTVNHTSVVAFTNSYILQTGTAKVTKSFSGLTSEQLPATFNITNNYDSSVFTYANADNAATADGINVPYEWSIANVPVETTITFAEQNATVTDYSLVAYAIPANYTCPAVTKDGTSTVTVINAYTPDAGE